MGKHNRSGEDEQSVTRRGAFYVRVSAVMGREPDEFHSPELQLRVIRSYAGREGIAETVLLKPDIDRTGRDFSREGVQQGFELAKSGAYDVLVVRDVSRFGRNVTDSLANIRRLREDHGVRVVSATEQFDDTPEGQFQLTLFLAMAELYSAQVGRRWAETHRHRIDGGHWHGVPPPGYRRPVDPDTAKVVKGAPIEPIPELAPYITQAFRDYAAGVAGVREIARRLTDAKGKHVPPITVRRMLRNPAYLGLVRIHETELRGGRRVSIPGTETTAPGLHEPLIDGETWESVQARIDRESTEPPRRRAEPVHAIVGLVTCSRCKARLILHRKRGVYHVECPKQGNAGCEGVGSPTANGILDVIVDHVEPWAEGPPARSEITKRRKAAKKRRDDEAAIRERLTDAETARARLTDQLARGIVSEDAYRATARDLGAEITRYRRQLDKLQPVTVATHDPLSDVLGGPYTGDPTDLLARLDHEHARLQRLAAAMRDGRWATWTPAEQNRALRAADVSAVLRPNPRPGHRGTIAERVDVAI